MGQRIRHQFAWLSLSVSIHEPVTCLFASRFVRTGGRMQAYAVQCTCSVLSTPLAPQPQEKHKLRQILREEDIESLDILCAQSPDTSPTRSSPVAEPLGVSHCPLSRSSFVIAKRRNKTWSWPFYPFERTHTICRLIICCHMLLGAAAWWPNVKPTDS